MSHCWLRNGEALGKMKRGDCKSLKWDHLGRAFFSQAELDNNLNTQVEKVGNSSRSSFLLWEWHSTLLLTYIAYIPSFFTILVKLLLLFRLQNGRCLFLNLTLARLMFSFLVLSLFISLGYFYFVFAISQITWRWEKLLSSDSTRVLLRAVAGSIIIISTTIIINTTPSFHVSFFLFANREIWTCNLPH